MSATVDLPLTVSSVAPGSVPNSQPFFPSSATVTDTEITFSSFFSLRKISVRCAQGQASET